MCVRWHSLADRYVPDFAALDLTHQPGWCPAAILHLDPLDLAHSRTSVDQLPMVELLLDLCSASETRLSGLTW